jgi:hypothetical protein
MSKPEDIKIWTLLGIVATVAIVLSLPVYYFSVVKNTGQKTPVDSAEPATFVTSTK